MRFRRTAGAFPVAQRQSECGASRNENHVAQPKSIGVCYGLVICIQFVFLQFFFFSTKSQNISKSSCHICLVYNQFCICRV